MKILIVDDEPPIAMEIAETLREAGGYETRLAASNAKALDCLRRECFDVAVLDLNLRGELCTPVADACASAGIPFLILTGYDTAQIDGNISRMPIFTKLCKPASLVAAVQSLVGARKAAG
jgi:DNA-binding response OmpR family regulator